MSTGARPTPERQEAAALLRQRQEEILRRWEGRVRAEVPAARWHAPAVIRNSIPKLLDQLAGAIEFSPAPAKEPPAAAEEHAEQRAALAGYSLDQVVYEYHLLRRVVLDTLEADALLPREARVAIHDGIDAAVQLATDEYVARQQEALRASEERFRLLVSGVRDYAIFMLDPGGHIVTWNAGAERIKGYAAEEIVGHHFSRFYTPEDRAAGRPERGLAAAAADGAYRDEGWRLCKDGKRFWADVVITPVRDDRGNLHGFAKVTRDLTERRALEEALRQRVEELAVANRAKDEFLAMLSHELRNPLAPVLNAARAIRQVGTDNPVLQQAGSIVERQVRTFGRLVDDLLDMARITRGAVRLRPERVELGVLVRRAVDTARPQIDERGHRLTVTVPPDPVWLEADPVRVEQVLVNLLSNAAKYTQPGGHVWVTARAEQDTAAVSVRDTGVGIAPDLLPRVFDLFAQGPRPVDRVHGGLGVGLSLARALVELHGGSIEARSEGPGKGSEFLVRLPAANDESRVASNESGPHSSLATRHSLLPNPSSLKVLLVDDNVDSTDSLALLLRLHGHEVRVAYDGPTALEVARRHPPDVTFLDIGLPGMDGYEVAKRLKAEGTTGRLLVALTGYGQESDRARARAAGFDHHLVKPADPERIQELLGVLAAPIG